MFKFPDRLHFPPIPRPGFSRPNRGTLHRRLWYAVLAAVLVLSGTLELLIETLESIAGVLFDLVEENLEAFYRKSAHLDTRGAQMATAYTYLALVIVFALTVGRRLWHSAARTANRVAAVAHQRSEHIRRHYRHYAGRAQRWWNSLDWINKIAVATAGVMGAIPLFLLLSYGLGTAVAELL